MVDGIEISERVLLFTTSERDGRLAQEHLHQVGVAAQVCGSIEDVCREIERGAGLAILTEDRLDEPAVRWLGACLARQPPWSDFPVLVVAGRPRREHETPEPLLLLGNVTLLDPPLRIRTLMRSVHAALRGRRRQYAARTAIHERDRFLAILGHELRNPLSAISLATEVAAMQSPGCTPQLAVMRRQIAHLTRLVDDLLDVARVTSGRIQLQREPTRLDTLVEEQILAAVRPRYVEAGIELTADLEAGAEIEADRVRFEQIVNNLLANALKFTPRGGHVHVETRREDDVVRLSVSDDGAGIAPDVLPQVFEQFVQGESTLDRSGAGLGLGLALVRTLVQLHGGTVTAMSAGKGMGSRFDVRVPALRRASAPASKQASPIATQEAAPCRVLVVEDNDDAREQLVLALRHFGHRVVEACDGEAALDVFEEESLDAAIIDLGLPKVDGYEVARRVRRDHGRELFLVALSGYGQPADVRRAKDAGYDVHLTKPADLSTLRAVLGGRP
jgi:signal transduction histidine kinase/CheY-like chemotaxis protein